MKTLYVGDFFSFIEKRTRCTVEGVVDLLEREYGARCYIAGGAVRDILERRKVADVDIECYDISPDEFADAMRKLKADGVGKSFFVYKIENVDISLPRVEKKVSAGHRGFEVSHINDMREACRRRDFTINAMLLDIASATVLDYWGGLRDIGLRVLRAVDPESFVEDSLRVLRAAQFSARFSYRIDRETCRLCREISLDDLPKERIFSEFEKIFFSQFPERGFHALCSMGVMDGLFDTSIGLRDFVTVSRAFLRYKEYFQSKLRRYYFVAVLYQYLRIDIDLFLERIGAPRIYFRKLSGLPRIPEPPDEAFAAMVARDTGVKESVLNYHPELREAARRIGVWEEPLDIGVTPRELLGRGFAGKELGEELERIRREKIETIRIAFEAKRRRSSRSLPDHDRESEDMS